MSHLASRAAAGHHEFIAVRIDAHGKVEGILGSVGWLSGECASVLFEPSNTCVEVVHPEAESRPGAFALTASVDPNGCSRDDDFTPGFRGKADLAIKQITIEVQASLPIGGPECVFDFFDLHGVSWLRC